MNKEDGDIKIINTKSGDKKRRNKGEGTIRKKGNTYEGRVTVKIQEKSKQISICNRDKRILIKNNLEPYIMKENKINNLEDLIGKNVFLTSNPRSC